MTDYFALFGLVPTFDLELPALEKTYFNLQRTHHPDRMAGKPEHERLAAVQQSMTINEAYQTLRSPLTRAEHILSQHGIRVNTEKDTVKPSLELLMEIMELREQLAEAAPETIQTLATDAENRIQQTMQTLSTSFEKQDWQTAAQATLRLGYLEKLRSEIKIHAQKKSRAS